MISEAAHALVQTALRPSSTDGDLQAAARRFLEQVRDAETDEQEAADALALLGRHFDLVDESRGAFLAMVGSLLVEQGHDPMAIATPLTECLADLLESTVDLVVACWPEVEGAGPALVAEFERARRRRTSEMPVANRAWESLGEWVHPALTVYARSREARRAASPLREWVYELAELHEACYWLDLVFSVLDDEPILVLEPEAERGFVGRMSGIVDNYQLVAWLMAVFPHPSASPLPSAALDVVSGKGPQQSDEEVLVPWLLEDGGSLLGQGRQGERGEAAEEEARGPAIVPFESAPEDFARFEGYRLIVLRPAPEPLAWRPQRIFEDLSSSLAVERGLEPGEVAQWLARLQAAEREQAD